MDQYMQLFSTPIKTGVATLVALMVVQVAVLAYFKKRQDGKVLPRLLALPCVALCVISTLLLTVAPLAVPLPSSLSLVPLESIINLLTYPSFSSTIQLLGNILLLSWIGVLAPVYTRARPARLVLLVVCTSLAIEAVQAVFSLGRTASIDDVLLNSLGGAVGILVGRKTTVPLCNSCRVAGVTPRIALKKITDSSRPPMGLIKSDPSRRAPPLDEGPFGILD